MQKARRRNPYPLTWEIPTAVIVAVALSLVYGVHLGRAAANVLAGGGWTWPLRDLVFRSLPGVLAGDATAGLARPALVAHAAGRTALTVCTVLVETALMLAIALCCRRAWQVWGPSRIRGMATRSEADTLLGEARLRRVAHVVRPDLYAPGRDRRASLEDRS